LCPAFDISGEKSEREMRLRRDPFKQRLDSGQNVSFTLWQLLREQLDVVIKKRAHFLFCRFNSTLSQNLTDDSRICSTGDFDALQIFVITESFFAGEFQGRDARATTGDQRAVDIEKDETPFFFFCHVERSRDISHC